MMDKPVTVTTTIYPDGRVSTTTKGVDLPPKETRRKRDPGLAGLADKIAASRGDPDYTAPRWDAAIVEWWGEQPSRSAALPELASRIRVYTVCHNYLRLSRPALEATISDFLSANPPLPIVPKPITPEHISEAAKEALGAE